MVNSPIIIQKAKEYDVEQIVNSILLAFSADPVLRWMYPSPQQYLKNFPNFVRAFGGKAFDAETAYYTDGYSGAALWLPPQSKPDNNAIGVFFEQTISQHQQEEVFALFEKMVSYHPDEPHWYLAIFGVEPNQQKKGYGSALMKHTLAIGDRDKKIAYLESSSLKSVRFYEKHGFEVIGKVQVGESPTIFPMVRDR
ncbi:Acetyltransferase [Hyella patelloides LEGE 07179]|uniref:Acetyltransferase n=1 Tax=Hyella patelloides LEGE 07179 TaxID=945734 RepID=A0A563VIY1_9CYAN|nr:GNAT family N-acetyltransferase [Hyella patelloides]VEP11398.1 Acetyltransferase [Hyella patelloides LEGE 07179]